MNPFTIKGKNFCPLKFTLSIEKTFENGYIRRGFDGIKYA